MFPGPLNRVHVTFTKPYGLEVERGNGKNKDTAKALNSFQNLSCEYIYKYIYIYTHIYISVCKTGLPFGMFHLFKIS